MSDVLCGAKVRMSSCHALSMIDRGHITSTLCSMFCSIKKSAAQIALAVFPVPCSLKQKPFLFSVKKVAVFFWC